MHRCHHTQLPPGVELKQLHGFKREDMPAVYAEARVLIDSYITGMERAIFEGALYDVVPLVAHHGHARDVIDMPLPEHLRWTPWDYEELGEKIANVLRDPDQALQAIAPLQTYAQAMPDIFEAQVLDFFADDALVRLPALPDAHGGMHARQFVYTTSVLGTLASVLLYPFSTVEVTNDASYYWSYDVTAPLAVLEHAGYGRSFTVRIFGGRRWLLFCI